MNLRSGIYQADQKRIPFSTGAEQMEEIASRFKLKLDESWNKEMLPQCGRHPHQYHEMVLRAMMEAVAKGGGSKEKFLEWFEKLVKEVVRRNPDLLRKSGWM